MGTFYTALVGVSIMKQESDETMEQRVKHAAPDVALLHIIYELRTSLTAICTKTLEMKIERPEQAEALGKVEKDIMYINDIIIGEWMSNILLERLRNLSKNP